MTGEELARKSRPKKKYFVSGGAFTSKVDRGWWKSVKRVKRLKRQEQVLRGKERSGLSVQVEAHLLPDADGSCGGEGEKQRSFHQRPTPLLLL